MICDQGWKWIVASGINANKMNKNVPRIKDKETKNACVQLN